MTGFADIHQHVLWGLDDGAKTQQVMQEMLRQDAAEGIRLVSATTHADLQHPFDMALYRARLAEANDFCRQENLPLQVVQGSEILYTDGVADRLAAGHLLALGNTRNVLIEFLPDVDLEDIGSAADALYRAGFHPVVAHIERYRCLTRSARTAMQLREDYGLLYQVNCHTVTAPHGWLIRRFVRKMLENRAVDVIADDAHNTSSRPVQMRQAMADIAAQYGQEYADALADNAFRLLGKSEAKGSL